MKVFSRFLLVGVAATAVQYLVYGALLQLLAEPAVVISTVGYLCGSAVSYLLNYHVTFRSSRGHASAVSRFYLMVAGAFVLNAVLVGALVDVIAFNPWVGQVVATAVCLAWNFVVSRHWVFSEAR